MLQKLEVTFVQEQIGPPSLHLLIVEDVMEDVELIVLTLEAAGITFTYDRADTATTCQQHLRSQTYNALLSDYRLPKLNGMQVLKILQESGQDIPLILVTGTLGEEAAVECIKAGMTDYVVKERLFRLPTVLARALEEFELRKAKQTAIAKIRASAWREAMINRIVQSMRGTLVLDEVLQTTANQLQEVLQVNYCLICQPQPDHQITACYISAAAHMDQQCFMEVNGQFYQHYRERLERSESVVINQIDSHLAPDLQDLAKDCGIRSLMIVPLLYQQSYLGEISLHQCDREREWTADEVTLMTAVADHCAIAIHQAQLYQQAQTELTERKRLEDVLRHQAEQLEQANRLKDEFLAIVSHELRTPLSTILCWSQLLRNKNFNDSTLNKAISSIERNAQAQAKIIDDILDMSRIIRNSIRLNTCSVDLATIIKAAIEDMRPIAEPKKIEVESVLSPSVGLISGDPGRLQQLIWNLLSNAVKFTPDEGRVQIRLYSTGNYAQIIISDTGIGISPDFLPYIFERFRQADSTSTREHGGLGLGLAIVRHLVELHGGTVHAASEGEGKGATFTVQLPLQKEKLDPNSHSSSISHPSLPTLNGLRVLLVDDDTDTCESLSAVLRQYGAQVTAVTSARAAFAAFADVKPDILISDIGMPEEDGYSLLSRVRNLESEQKRQTPAIALTAFARDEDRTQALETGFQIHMPKPVEPAQLVSVVAHLVE